jgi:SecD/SecF fusion protein
VISLLLFGGSTLKDFAFALMVGIASGAYSSIFIASPVLTHWKEREGAYRSRRARILRELGHVPAYATTETGAPEDIEPAQKRRRTRRGSLIAPEEPGQQISRDEFQELVADLDVDREPAAGEPAATQTKVARRPAVAQPKPAPPDAKPAPPDGAREQDDGGTEPPPRDPAADLAPEDLVLKDAPKPRPKRRGAASKRRKHGRSR